MNAQQQAMYGAAPQQQQPMMIQQEQPAQAQACMTTQQTTYGAVGGGQDPATKAALLRFEITKLEDELDKHRKSLPGFLLIFLGFFLIVPGFGITSHGADPGPIFLLIGFACLIGGIIQCVIGNQKTAEMEQKLANLKREQIMNASLIPPPPPPQQTQVIEHHTVAMPMVQPTTVVTTTTTPGMYVPPPPPPPRDNTDALVTGALVGAAVVGGCALANSNRRWCRSCWWGFKFALDYIVKSRLLWNQS